MTERVPWRRSSQRWVGGVAAGIAQRLGIDPALVRALFLLVTLVGGAGLIGYGLAWLLLPDAQGPSVARELLHGRPRTDVIWAVMMVLVGLTRPVFWWSRWYWGDHPLYWLSIWALAVATMLTCVALGLSWRARRRRQRLEGTLPPAVSWGPAPQPETTVLPVPSPAVPDATPTQPLPGIQAPAPQPALSPQLDVSRASAPRPRTPGPGARQWQLTLAALLLAAAVVVGRDAGRLTVVTWLLLGGVEVAILGASVAVAGLRGRRGGGITALATLGVLVAAPALALGTQLPGQALASGQMGGCDVGQAPASGDVTRTCMAGSGEVIVRRGAYSDVTLTNGIGYTSVAVETGAAVRITGHLGLGELRISNIPAGWQVTVDGELLSPNSYSVTDSSEPSEYYLYVQNWDTQFELVSPAAQHGGRAATVSIEHGVGSVNVYQLYEDTTSDTEPAPDQTSYVEETDE